jgi:shikimate kinase
MEPLLARKGFVLVALIMAALLVALGIHNAFFNPASDAAQLGAFWAAMIGFGPAGVILVGLGAQRRWPAIGDGLVLVGAVPLGLLMWWTIVGPVLALMLVALWLGAGKVVRA